MYCWCPQQFRKKGSLDDIDSSVLDHANQNAELVQAVNPDLPPIFSLKNLSYLT